MHSLSKSIKSNGIIAPIIVRPIEDDKYQYEIISGHRRKRATELAGLKTIPCNIQNFDDNRATILMVDSNLQQRENILPSEKAWAYCYKLEAIRSQGKRNDLITSCQVGIKLDSGTLISNDSDDNRRNIYRYVHLTHLIPPLLEKMDTNQLAFIPAVALSYLKIEEQKWLLDILDREENYSVPIATKLKAISQGGTLTYDKIDKIFINKNREAPKAIKVKYTAIKEYFSPDTTLK